jgi:protein-S-isoprenylcysteine O-methyltransferase
LPTSGADWAVVRFLTPEACEKYFKATENGIEVQGDKKTVVFVEKQAAPSSINDVMRNCTEGDASRCVRATDAEDDWSDMLLMKLAKGKGTSKREVDRIKRGKTARGRYYIEFRFANIYHALQFKRQLMDDPEWEHCTIAYATDPCETARGIHYKDEDEDGSAAGSFA